MLKKIGEGVLVSLAVAYLTPVVKKRIDLFVEGWKESSLSPTE